MEFTSQSAVSRPIVVKGELSMILSNPVPLISCSWAEIIKFFSICNDSRIAKKCMLNILYSMQLLLNQNVYVVNLQAATAKN